MSLSKQKKMNVLLEQIQLNDIKCQTYFDESTIEKLEVFTKSKRWHFHIKLKDVLPIKIYKTFIEHIHNSFNNIAKTEVSLYIDDPTFDEKLISDYWQYFLSTYAQIPPGINGEVLQQTPEINGQQIIIRVNNKPQSDRKSTRLNSSHVAISY